MQDTRIKSKFPMSDKIKMGLNCLRNKKSGIEQIFDSEALFNFKDVYQDQE